MADSLLRSEGFKSSDLFVSSAEQGRARQSIKDKSIAIAFFISPSFQLHYIIVGVCSVKKTEAFIWITIKAKSLPYISPFTIIKSIITRRREQHGRYAYL